MSCAAAILVYHSIADVERDPFGITVAPADFEGQLEVLAQRFNVLTVEEVREGLERGELPDRAVVVTFDDGYANNLRAALPALAAHGVPATVFVASDYIGEVREFWWDEIERLVCVERPADAEPVLELAVSGDRLRCPMDDGAGAVRRIASWLQGLPVGSVEQGLAQLQRWAGADESLSPRETHRPLSVEELRELALSPQIEMGAHTRTHLRLGAQEPEVQRTEIEGSRADLESWLGAAPVTFAYPFGNPDHDYSPDTVAIVRAAGFEAAFSGHPGLADPASARYELPRWFVSTPEPREFERWLANRFRSLPMRAASKAMTRIRRGR